MENKAKSKAPSRIERNTSRHQDKQVGESSAPRHVTENAARSDLCGREETNGNLLCQSCADMISPFALAPPAPGTELALAVVAELAPYLAAD
jgi:hypothetical protein